LAVLLLKKGREEKTSKSNWREACSGVGGKCVWEVTAWSRKREMKKLEEKGDVGGACGLNDGGLGAQTAACIPLLGTKDKKGPSQKGLDWKWGFATGRRG